MITYYIAFYKCIWTTVFSQSNIKVHKGCPRNKLNLFNYNVMLEHKQIKNISIYLGIMILSSSYCDNSLIVLSRGHKKVKKQKYRSVRDRQMESQTNKNVWRRRYTQTHERLVVAFVAAICYWRGNCPDNPKTVRII